MVMDDTVIVMDGMVKDGTVLVIDVKVMVMDGTVRSATGANTYTTDYV
jgi:hypothetical protein